jgi:hypothetical protein
LLHKFLPDCPVADDTVTLTWELAANACRHSRSRYERGLGDAWLWSGPCGGAYSDPKPRRWPWDAAS